MGRRGEQPPLELTREDTGDTRTREELENQALMFMESIGTRLKPDFGPRAPKLGEKIRDARDQKVKALGDELARDVWLTREVCKQLWKQFGSREHMLHDLSFEELRKEPRWKRKLRHPSTEEERGVWEVAKTALQKIIASRKTKDYERQVALLYIEGLGEAEQELANLKQEIRYHPANDTNEP